MLSVTTFSQCVLELVLNSLSANSSSVAIRIHLKNREIQVVDDGMGVPKDSLLGIGEYEEETSMPGRAQDMCCTEKSTLIDIRRLSNKLTISSRFCNTQRTFTKLGQQPSVIETIRRPSRGTTVSVYGFYELPWSKENHISNICFLIASIALVNSKVSFSVRDDEQAKVILGISKPHKATDIIRALYDQTRLPSSMCCIKNNQYSLKYQGFIGSTYKKWKSSKQIFLNGRPIHCPIILQFVLDTFIKNLSPRIQDKRNLEKRMIILFFITCSRSEYTIVIKGKEKAVVFYRLQRLLNNIGHDLIQNSLKHHKNRIRNKIMFIKPNTNSTILNLLRDWFKENLIKLDDSDAHKNRGIEFNLISQLGEQISQNQRKEDNKNIIAEEQNNYLIEKTYSCALSEWSNWTLDNQENIVPTNHIENNSRFNFLPQKLNALLRWKNNKITNINYSSKIMDYGELMQIPRHEEINVRPCKFVNKFSEFRLKKKSLKFIKILNQINNELIAALTIQNKRKILLLMDQHAVHERICYENLLNRYKRCDEMSYIKLKDPITIQLPMETCKLLLSNKILKKFGINLTSLNENTLSIYSIPKCLERNKYYNDFKLIRNVQNLLNEILEKPMNENDLPTTFHNAIAMKACHEAIKFGDPLNIEQCTCLIELLKNTKCPMRCAHGRPSIVPILEFPSLRNRFSDANKRKLNFSSLKIFHQKKNKM